MPGPGNNKKNNKRSRSHHQPTRDISKINIPSVLDTFIDQVNDQRGWDNVCHLLCVLFELPGLETRSGMKRAHTQFDEIQPKLEAAYNKYRGNDKVVGGIVGIWAKMSMDSLLRDKLVRAGLISKIIPLLDRRPTRIVGLEALSTVTHHGGSAVKRQIATESVPTLLRLMEEFPEDIKLNELAVVTLSHAVGAIVNDDENQPSVVARNVRKFDIPKVMQLVISNVRKPNATFNLLSHALEFFLSTANGCHKEMMAIPTTVNLMVACLRSNDLSTRVSALGAVLRLVTADSVPDKRDLDPQRFMSALQRGLPRDLTDYLIDYNPFQCDTFQILKCSRTFQGAMMQAAQDHDLYKLGKTLAELIVTTEYSIAEGAFQSINERTGRVEFVDVGLPFRTYSEALPLCARALRATGAPADLNAADIVEIKYFIMKGRVPDAVDLAQRAIERSPQVAYYYYAIGLGADQNKGLRMSKKGLKCKIITPFVRNYLLWRATDHAGNLAFNKLLNNPAGVAPYQEGVAFLMSAHEDAKTFVESVPPDTRTVTGILHWYILLDLAVRGPEIGTDMRELDPAFEKLRASEAFMRYFGMTISNTQLKLAKELVVKRYADAWREWGDLIARMDSMQSSAAAQEHSTAHAEDNLSRWLEGLDIADAPEHSACAQPSSANPATLALYRCSHCRNPSAVLRKCAGCGKTRYCDAACQKIHWSEHKVACKAAQAAAQNGS